MESRSGQLGNIDLLRIGSIHVEPPFDDADLLGEIEQLESEVADLRSILLDCEAAMGGDGTLESFIGLPYCFDAANQALCAEPRYRALLHDWLHGNISDGLIEETRAILGEGEDVCPCHG